MLVDADVNGHGFSALLIESAFRPDWLQVGNTIDLVFKETEVSLAKNLQGQISMRNRMKCVVREIERGDLLSKIKLSFINSLISSAITTRAVDSLKLEIDEECYRLRLLVITCWWFTARATGLVTGWDGFSM